MFPLFLPLVFVKRLKGRKTAKNFFFCLFINPDKTLTTANIAKHMVLARWIYNPINFIRYQTNLDYQYKRHIIAHETKVQVLTLFYGLDEKDCRNAETLALLREHPLRFRRVSFAWINRQMYLQREKQRKWVFKNYKSLKKHRKKVEKFRNKIDKL